MTAERIRRVTGVDTRSKPRSVTFETDRGREVKKEVHKGKGTEITRLGPEVKEALDTLKPLAREVISRRGQRLDEDDQVYFDTLEWGRKGELDYMEARRLACITLGNKKNRIGSVKAAELILRQNPDILTRLCLGSETKEGFDLAIQDFAAVIVEYYPRNFPANAVRPRR